MSDFFGKLKSGAEKVAFEAEKAGRLNRAKGDLEKIKNQIQAQYTKLGELYYNKRATAGVTGAEYDEICQAIQDLDNQIESMNEEVRRITAETYAPQGAQPAPQHAYEPPQVPSAPAPGEYTPPPMPAAAATKFCQNCGKELPPAVKFCPDCGTAVQEK